MNLNVQMVESLNKKAAALNADRQRKIGAQEAAKEAYERAVYAYAQKYGVTLDDTNLQNEYDFVVKKLEREYEAQRELINSIENKTYSSSSSGSVGVGSVVGVQTPSSDMVVQEDTKTSSVDVSDKPFTPNGWGSPNKSDLNKKFDSILGANSKFGKNG